MVALAYNPFTQESAARLPEIQARLSYIISYRIAWDTNSLKEIKIGWKSSAESVCLVFVRN